MVHPRVLAQSGFRMVFLSAALAAMACQSGTDGVTYRASIDTATDAGSTSKPLSMAVPRTDEQALSETPSDPVNVGPSDLSKLTIRREETFEHVDLIAPERHIDGLVALLGAESTTHGGAIDDLAFGPDGLLLASGGGRVSVWSATGEQVRVDERKREDASVRLLNDGRWLFEWSDRDLIVYAAGVREPKHILRGSNIRLMTRPDGDRMFALTDKGLIGFEMSTGTLLWRNQASSDPVALAGLEGLLAVAYDDGRVHFLDGATGETRQELYLGPHRVTEMAISGNQLVVGTDHGDLSLVDLTSRTITQLAYEHFASIGALALSGDGQTLYSGDLNGDFRVWSLATLEVVAQDHVRRAIHHIAIAPEGVAAADRDGQLFFWSSEIGAFRNKVLRHPSSIAELREVGPTVIARSVDERICWWDLAARRPERCLSQYFAATVGIDGSPVALAYADHIELRDPNKGALLLSIPVTGRERPFEMLFSARGDLISLTYDAVERINPSTGERTDRMTFDDIPDLGLTVSADGCRVGVQFESYQLYDLCTQTKVATLPGLNNGASMSPDGQLVVGRVQGDLVAFREPFTKSKTLWSTNGEEIEALQFDPFGEFLLAGGALGTRVWSSDKLALMAHNPKIIPPIAFSRGILMSFDEQGVVLFYRASDLSLKGWLKSVDDQYPNTLLATTDHVVVGNSEGTISVWDRNFRTDLPTFDVVKFTPIDDWGGSLGNLQRRMKLRADPSNLRVVALDGEHWLVAGDEMSQTPLLSLDQLSYARCRKRNPKASTDSPIFLGAPGNPPAVLELGEARLALWSFNERKKCTVRMALPYEPQLHKPTRLDFALKSSAPVPADMPKTKEIDLSPTPGVELIRMGEHGAALVSASAGELLLFARNDYHEVTDGAQAYEDVSPDEPFDYHSRATFGWSRTGAALLHVELEHTSHETGLQSQDTGEAWLVWDGQAETRRFVRRSSVAQESSGGVEETVSLTTTEARFPMPRGEFVFAMEVEQTTNKTALCREDPDDPCCQSIAYDYSSTRSWEFESKDGVIIELAEPLESYSGHSDPPGCE